MVSTAFQGGDLHPAEEGFAHLLEGSGIGLLPLGDPCSSNQRGASHSSESAEQPSALPGAGQSYSPQWHPQQQHSAALTEAEQQRSAERHAEQLPPAVDWSREKSKLAMVSHSPRS